MLLDLNNALDLEKFKAKVAKCLRDKPVVELCEKTPRTSSQNRYLHLLIGLVAIEVGVTLDYAKEEYFKKLINKDIFCVDVEDKFCGRVCRLRSSADLTKEETSIAIDRFKQWGREQGMYMPEPNDAELLRMIEVEMGRMRRYL